MKLVTVLAMIPGGLVRNSLAFEKRKKKIQSQHKIIFIKIDQRKITVVVNRQLKNNIM